MTRLSQERDGSTGPGWDLLNRLLFDPDDRPLRRVLLVLIAALTALLVVLVVMGFVAKEVGTSLELGGGLAVAGAATQQALRYRRKRQRHRAPGTGSSPAED